MIKEALFTLIGSGVLAVCELQAQAVTTPMVTLKQPRFNLGVKAGFNSSMFFTDEISINGKELELAQYHSRKCFHSQHISQLGNSEGECPYQEKNDNA